MISMTPMYFIKFLNTHADKINLFVALSNFYFDDTNKHSRIYCSVFFVFGKNVFDFKIFDEGMHSYHFKNLLVVDIVPGLNSKDALNPEPIKYHYSGSTLIIRQTSLAGFFNKDYLKNLSFLYGSKKDSSIILHFKGVSWPVIKTAFKLFNIHIGGDNNTLKHILSPHQFLLSKFIMTYFGPNSDYVNDSFNAFAKDKALARAVFDFTSDKGKEFLKDLERSLRQDTNIDATSNKKKPR